MFKQYFFIGTLLVLNPQLYAMAPLLKVMKTGATYGVIFAGALSSPLVMAKNLSLEEKMFLPMIGAGIGAVSGTCVGVASYCLSPHENGKSELDIHMQVGAAVIGTLGTLAVMQLRYKLV